MPPLREDVEPNVAFTLQDAHELYSLVMSLLDGKLSAVRAKRIKAAKVRAPQHSAAPLPLLLGCVCSSLQLCSRRKRRCCRC
jgi:hypothetical protein